jgi:hypothetical protein
MLRELPDRLRGMRDERRLSAQQALVPRLRGAVIADPDAGEEVESHRQSVRVLSSPTTSQNSLSVTCNVLPPEERE